MRDLIVSSLYLSALIQAMLVVYAWTRPRQPGVLPLIGLGVIGFVWAFSYGVDLASDDLPVKLFWMQIRFSFTVFTSLVVLLFVNEYLELGWRFTRWQKTGLLAVPVITLLLIWTSPYHQLFRYDFQVQRVGPLAILTWISSSTYWLNLIYSNVLLATSIYLLFRSYASSGPIRRRQTTLALTALLIPLVVDLLYNFGLTPIPRFNFTPLVLALSWFLLAYAIFRYGLLDALPLARSKLVDIIPSGVIVVDARGRIIDINPTARQVLRLTPAVIGLPLNRALSGLENAILAQVDPDKPRQEIRVQTLTDQSAYYDIENIPLVDKSGGFNGRLIMFHDVTSRKMNELRLLQLTQAVDQSPTSVVITDLQGMIEYVNPQFTNLTGYSSAEALGKSTSLVKSGQTPPEVYQAMWHTIQSGQTWSGEFLNRKKNGDLYWERAVIAPVKDPTGEIINYIAIKENITEMKTAEDALRRSEAELRAANCELEDRIAQISALQTELREQALHDPLTGLHNRRALGEFIEREMILSQRSGQPLSVILIDIDHFKSVNDRYGHQAGDEFLKMLANLLSAKARKSDLVCRYGGEEFLLTLPATPLEAARRRAEEICQTFAGQSLVYQDLEIRSTLSLGIACYPLHGATVDAILSRADQALYHAKDQGRNRVSVWHNAE